MVQRKVEASWRVIIDDPISVNHAFATDFNSGRRFLTSQGKEYAGEMKPIPKRKGIPDGALPGKRDKIYIPGRVYHLLKEAGVPAFPERMKVIVEAWAIWPNRVTRDMSNLQKLVEDVFQKGGFVKNDAFILWRNMDFRVEKDVHRLILEIRAFEEAP